MYTGYTVLALVSRNRLGVRVIRPVVARAARDAVFALSPGSLALEFRRSPVLASTERPVLGLVTDGADEGVESHIIGAGAVKKARPVSSCAFRFPAASPT